MYPGLSNVRLGLRKHFLMKNYIIQTLFFINNHRKKSDFFDNHVFFHNNEKVHPSLLGH